MFQTHVVEKIKTDILCPITFFRKSAVYDIMWKNMVQPHRPHDKTTRRMRFACWITKATHTLGICNSLLIAFPRQQWLRERASVLRLYVHCLPCSSSVLFSFNSLQPSFKLLKKGRKWERRHAQRIFL